LGLDFKFFTVDREYEALLFFQLCDHAVLFPAGPSMLKEESTLYNLFVLSDPRPASVMIS